MRKSNEKHGLCRYVSPWEKYRLQFLNLRKYELRKQKEEKANGRKRKKNACTLKQFLRSREVSRIYYSAETFSIVRLLKLVSYTLTIT